MSAPANSQQAAKGLKNDLLLPSGGAIDAGISTGGTYSLMSGSQAEFWT
jgi:hypothetical protein